MTKEELREHCEKQVKMCEEWARGNDREPSGKVYEEHKLVLDLIKASEDTSYELWKESYEVEHARNIRLEEKIKALEQQPCEDCVSRQAVLDLSDFVGKMPTIDHYGDTLEEVVSVEKIEALPSVTPKIPTSDDCVSREGARQFLYEEIDRLNNDELYDIFSKIIDDMYNELPPVTPTYGACKDCKQLGVMDCGYYCKLNHWGKISTESNYGGMGDFYCIDFEKRGAENE